MNGRQIKSMNKNEVNRLLRNGEPGAVSITQLTDAGLVSFWIPSLDDMPVSKGALEKFESYKEAERRAGEIKAEAAAADHSGR